LSEHHYAAWVVFDLRLLTFVGLISLFLALGTVALLFRGKRWHDYVTGFVSIYFAIVLLTILVFNSIASYPVFLVEDIFQFP